MHPKMVDHFSYPRNVGELPAPAITVEVSNPVCGDILRLSALMDKGRVTKTGFKTRGCTASIAAGSALTELMAGKSRAELAGITAAHVESALGELPPESKHAAMLCAAGVRALVAKLPAA